MTMFSGEEIILASASPRRADLLRASGIDFRVCVSKCAEEIVPEESAEQMVRRLSFEKAHDVSQQFRHRWVLGADTTVVIDGEILGKPEDEADARRMLGKISGRTHEVWGGFTILNAALDVVHTESHRSAVDIVKLSDTEVLNYIKTGEPMDKAGAYAIQGIGAGLVSKVVGSYTNVVGLNLSAVIQALLQLNVFENKR